MNPAERLRPTAARPAGSGRRAGNAGRDRHTDRQHPKQAVVCNHRRERSERWQVVGVGPHDKLEKDTDYY